MENPFQIGDVVETTREYQGCPAGMIGTVAFRDDDSCYVDFGKEYAFTHDLQNLGGGDKYYWINMRYLRIIESPVDLPEISDKDFDSLLAGGVST